MSIQKRFVLNIFTLFCYKILSGFFRLQLEYNKKIDTNIMNGLIEINPVGLCYHLYQKSIVMVTFVQVKIVLVTYLTFDQTLKLGSRFTRPNFIGETVLVGFVLK